MIAQLHQGQNAGKYLSAQSPYPNAVAPGLTRGPATWTFSQPKIRNFKMPALDNGARRAPPQVKITAFAINILWLLC